MKARVYHAEIYGNLCVRFDTYDDAVEWGKEVANEIRNWTYPEDYREVYKGFRPCIYELDSENHYKFIAEF